MWAKFYQKQTVSICYILNWNIFIVLFKVPPAGVVLEAPFKNILQATIEYVVSAPFLNNPWIINKVAEAFDSIDLRFENDKK